MQKQIHTFLSVCRSLFSDLRNLSGTTLMNLLAALFMAQLLYVIGVGGVQVGNVTLTQLVRVFWQSIPIAEARKVCNVSWQCIKHVQYSALYDVLPQSLIKHEASFQDGQDSNCILQGYDTVQCDTTFRKNILPPCSVFNTDVGLLFRLIVDHCFNVVRGQVCWSMRNGSLWDLGRKVEENSSIIRQCVTTTVQTLY